MSTIRPHPSVLRAAALVAAFGCLAGTANAQAPQMFKAGPGPDELWDVTVKMEMVGMPMAMPATTSQVCMKKDRGAEKMVPQNKDCQTLDVRNVGNRMTFRFVCKGEEPMEGTGEITSTPTSYDGRMTMKGTRRGSDMNMVQNFSGKKVGTCTDTSAQTIAKIEAEGAAQVARMCAEGMESLSAEYFVGKGAACASQAKAFCDKVGGIAAGGRTPAGYRAAVGRPGGALIVRNAFAACKQDFNAMQAAACGSGVSSRDWSFVGSGACDADVRKQGEPLCKGRAFTGMDRAIVPLCSRYAALSRGASANDDGGGSGGGGGGGSGGSGGGGGAASGSSGTVAPGAGTAPRAPAKAEEPKPANGVDSAVTEGVNQLKKLLPF